MTFAVIGGGPSGVELPGLSRSLPGIRLRRISIRIDAKSTTVLLLKWPANTPRLPEELARYAQRKLESLGVTVRENCAVKNISSDSVDAGDDTIPIGLAIWAAGVKASSVGKLLGVPTETGRVPVQSRPRPCEDCRMSTRWATSHWFWTRPASLYGACASG